MADFKKIRESFHQKGLMKPFGAGLQAVEPGMVAITADFQDRLTQKNTVTFLGEVLTSLVNTACGYAALSSAPGDHEMLTVELINFLEPANINR